MYNVEEDEVLESSSMAKNDLNDNRKTLRTQEFDIYETERAMLEVFREKDDGRNFSVTTEVC